MKVILNSMEKVKEFVNLMSDIDGNIDLVSGRYVVDAKSILGIFSLDLSKPIHIEFNGVDDQPLIERSLRRFTSI